MNTIAYDVSDDDLFLRKNKETVARPILLLLTFA